MAETKIYIADDVDAKLRELAMARFGYGRGSISAAVEEAIVHWINEQVLIKKTLGEVVDMAKNDPYVVAVILFGSYSRKEKDYKDVDVAILTDGKARSFVELNKYIKAKSNISAVHIEISILNDLPIDVQRDVLSEGSVLYVRDKDRLYDYSLKIAEKWGDYEHRLHIMSEAHA